MSIDNKVFCQEIIDGKEFTFDCLVYDNKIIDFIISEKIKVKNIKYVSQTILLSSINKNERKKFYDLINRFLEKININQGIFHFEIIRDKNSNLFIIDVAPRGPGFFVLEDYLNNISSRNWINDYLDMVTNQFNKKKFKSLSKKPHLIHFITKKNGTYKYIKILKNNLKYKITYFVKNNTQTVSSKNDSSRIASIILNNKNSKKLLKDLKVIKKSFIPKYSNENLFFFKKIFRLLFLKNTSFFSLAKNSRLNNFESLLAELNPASEFNDIIAENLIFLSLEKIFFVS